MSFCGNDWVDGKIAESCSIGKRLIELHLNTSTHETTLHTQHTAHKRASHFVCLMTRRRESREEERTKTATRQTKRAAPKKAMKMFFQRI